MIVRTLSQQGSGVLYEDALVTKDPYFVVADGATALTDFLDGDGYTSGKAAANMIAGQFQRRHGNLMERFLAANDDIDAYKRRHHLHALHEFPVAVCAAVCIGDTSVEYAQIGDCMIGARYSDGRAQWLTSDSVETIETLARQLHPDSADQRRDFKRSSMNTHTGMGVLNGDPAAEYRICRGTIQRDGLQSIYLVTDGMRLPSSWDETLGFLCQHDIFALHEYVRMEERRLGASLERKKLHDDSTAIEIDFCDRCL